MPDPESSPTIETFTLGPFQTNCYLVRSGASACWIVDAGADPEPLVRRVRELGLTPARIILTHAHADHIAGLEAVRSAFPDTPVLIHSGEADFLSDPMLNLSAALGESLVVAPADHLLTGSETLDLAGAPWRVMHTPGHSPGGITLWCENAGMALVGDTLFAGSIGRSDFPTSDGPTLLRSIRDVLFALPDETRVLPGHGPETTIGQEKLSNPYLRP